MLQSTDFGFVHFHRPQLDRLGNGDATNVIDGLLAIADRTPAQFFKGQPSRFDSLVGTGEQAVATAGGGPFVAEPLLELARGLRLRAGGRGLATYFLNDLSNDAADKLFANLHFHDFPNRSAVFRMEA